MKDTKTVGGVLLVVGLVILVLSLLADVIGLGGAAGYGYKQILGAIVGAIVAVAGLFLVGKK